MHECNLLTPKQFHIYIYININIFLYDYIITCDCRVLEYWRPILRIEDDICNPKYVLLYSMWADLLQGGNECCFSCMSSYELNKTKLYGWWWAWICYCFNVVFDIQTHSLLLKLLFLVLSMLKEWCAWP